MIQYLKSFEDKTKTDYYPEQLNCKDYVRIYTSIPYSSTINIREGIVIEPEGYRKRKNKGIAKAVRLNVLKKGEVEKEKMLRKKNMNLEEIIPYTKTFSYSNIRLIERLESDKWEIVNPTREH